MEIVLAFLAGLLIGSFLNVCIYRLPRDLSVAKPARSFCPGCKTTIAWYDNIPLISYLVLRGKSRCCQESIPLRYPVVEFTTGVFFALSVSKFGLTLDALKWMIFSSTLINLAVTDFETRLLPDEFTIGGTVIGLILSWFVPMEGDVASFLLSFNDANLTSQQISFIESLIGTIFCAALMWFVAWAFQKIRHKEGMGMGDIKMLLLIGSFIGTSSTLYCIFLASVFGSLIGPLYALVAKRGLIQRLAPRIGSTAAIRSVIFRYQLPFGTFLGLTALITPFWL